MKWILMVHGEQLQIDGKHANENVLAPRRSISISRKGSKIGVNTGDAHDRGGQERKLQSAQFNRTLNGPRVYIVTLLRKIRENQITRVPLMVITAPRSLSNLLKLFLASGKWVQISWESSRVCSTFWSSFNTTLERLNGKRSSSCLR